MTNKSIDQNVQQTEFVKEQFDQGTPGADSVDPSDAQKAIEGGSKPAADGWKPAGEVADAEADLDDEPGVPRSG